MINATFVTTMASYNQWQNTGLYRAAGNLSEADRHENRGAFFRSIHGTLCHLLWGDMFWMSRFDGWTPPLVGLAESPGIIEEWDALRARRAEVDTDILDWAGRVSEDWLDGDVTWFSGLRQRNVTRPAALCVMHFFNHQTHHRGQAHAMLTAAGATPDDTDIVAMPRAM